MSRPTLPLILVAAGLLIAAGLARWQVRSEPPTSPTETGPGACGPAALTEGAPAEPPSSDDPEAGSAAISPTATTLYAHLLVGRERAELSFLQRKEVPFRPLPLPGAGDEAFEVELDAGARGRWRGRFGVSGLLPEDTPPELLDEDGELVLGDVVFASAAPILLKLPDVAPPFILTLTGPGGRRIGAFPVETIATSGGLK